MTAPILGASRVSPRRELLILSEADASGRVDFPGLLSGRSRNSWLASASPDARANGFIRRPQQGRPASWIVGICGNNVDEGLVEHALGPIACSFAESPCYRGRRELH